MGPEAGFTLLETLVEVLLVSLALGCLALVAATSVKAWEAQTSAVWDRAAGPLFWAAAEKAAASVRFPPWTDLEGGQDWASSRPGRPLVVAWAGGDPEAQVTFASEADRVSVRGPGIDQNLTAPGAWWEALRDPSGRVVGVELHHEGRRWPFRFSVPPWPEAR